MCVCIWDLTFVWGLTSAPWLRRTSATLILSSWAAKWRGVSPLYAWYRNKTSFVIVTVHVIQEISCNSKPCEHVPYCRHWHLHSWLRAVTPGPHFLLVLPDVWGRCPVVLLRWCQLRTPAVWSQYPFGSFWQQCAMACNHSGAIQRNKRFKNEEYSSEELQI